MPSITRSRRIKPLLTLAVLIILTILYLTSSPHSTRNSAFYKNTVSALQQQHQQQAQSSEADHSRSDTSEAKLKQDLQDAGTRAKEVANRKGEEMRKKFGMEEIAEEEEAKQVPLKEQAAKEMNEMGGAVEEAVAAGAEKEKSVAGRKTMKDETKSSVVEELVVKSADVAKETDAHTADQDDEEAAMEAKVEEELNSILKRSPIIIFSKTYCPYSKKAKHVLLENYKITPAPYVVELDEHELGPALQASLTKSTGRRTVPNVLINGKSIGGGNDIQALHDEGKLIDTVKTMGGKRIMEVSLVKEKEVGEDGLRRRRVRR